MTENSNEPPSYKSEIEKRKGVKPTFRNPLGGIEETPEWKEAEAAMRSFDKKRPLKKTTEEDPS